MRTLSETLRNILIYENKMLLKIQRYNSAYYKK